MNVGVIVKNQMIQVLVKMNICGIVKRVIVSIIRHAKLRNTQILKTVHVKKLIDNQHYNVKMKY